MDALKRFLGPVIYIISAILILIMVAFTSSESAATDLGLTYSYILIIVVMLGIVLGFVITAITNPQAILKTVVGIVVVAIIWFISYAMANNEVLPKYEEFGVDAGLSQTVGGVLILTYGLLLLTIIGILFTEVKGIFK